MRYELAQQIVETKVAELDEICSREGRVISEDRVQSAFRGFHAEWMNFIQFQEEIAQHPPTEEQDQNRVHVANLMHVERLAGYAMFMLCEMADDTSAIRRLVKLGVKGAHIQCEDDDCTYTKGHEPPHSHQEQGV